MRFRGDDGERNDDRVGLHGIEHSRRHPVEKRGPVLRLSVSLLAKTWIPAFAGMTGKGMTNE